MDCVFVVFQIHFDVVPMFVPCMQINIFQSAPVIELLMQLRPLLMAGTVFALAGPLVVMIVYVAYVFVMMAATRLVVSMEPYSLKAAWTNIVKTMLKSRLKT